MNQRPPLEIKTTNLLEGGGGWEKIFVTKIRQRFLKYDTKTALSIKQMGKWVKIKM